MGASIPVVTLDGPAGAGKGTVSRAIAQRLGWHYLDSGAIYRSLAVAVLDAGVDLEDVDGIVAVANRMVLSFHAGNVPAVILDGQDISLPHHHRGMWQHHFQDCGSRAGAAGLAAKTAGISPGTWLGGGRAGHGYGGVSPTPTL